MIRKFTTFFLFTFFISVALYGQVVKITLEPYGVSPRDVVKSTTDIYTNASTGLSNVGLGSMVYIKASITGKKFGTVTWTNTRYPAGTTAKVSTTADIINDSVHVYSFKPDKLGAYELTLTDGSYTKSIVINSAKYLGYTNTVINNVDTKVNCGTCHSSYVTKWQGTNHATMFTRAMKATPGLSGPTDHYSQNCISCHNTGYDTDATAVNDGFDDHGFVYPSNINPNTYDTLLTKYPQAMLRANIQCEACHGPASGHMGVTSDSRIKVSYDAAVCAYCHDSGTHHIFPEQFDYSRHAGADSYPTGPGREACVKCHTGKGFAQFAKGIQTNDPYFDAEYTPITCAGCHDPHDATNVNQLRKITVKLINGEEITQGGKGKLCMNCHQSRTVANEALVADKAAYARFSPHYSDQADIMSGKNVYTFDKTFASTNHLGVAEHSCVTCHMATGEAIPGQVNLVGQHTFAMSSNTGVDNMKACASCHGYSLGSSFKEVRYFPQGKGDLDMNGVVEGLQEEIHGLLEACAALLPLTHPEDWSHEDPTKTWTVTQRKAFYNMKAIYYDGSYGIHNPAFTYNLLKETYLQLGGVVSVDEEESIPTEYVLSQNFPNPFNPSTNIRFSLPRTSHVRLTIYDVLGKEITTLVNNELAAGTHTLAWNASNLASGIYLYKIEADNFNKVNKMLLLK